VVLRNHGVNLPELWGCCRSKRSGEQPGGNGLPDSGQQIATSSTQGPSQRYGNDMRMYSVLFSHGGGCGGIDMKQLNSWWSRSKIGRLNKLALQAGIDDF
jgi:hypothetical protein